jgi:hypothetical protein
MSAIRLLLGTCILPGMVAAALVAACAQYGEVGTVLLLNYTPFCQ